MVTFSFILTEECNWTCKYCAFPSIEKPTYAQMDVMDKHLKYIKDFINKIEFLSNRQVGIEVQGGELGLIPHVMLGYFLNTLGRKVSISTNGLFLENSYHLKPSIRPYIKEIMWHLYESPTNIAIPDYIDDELTITRGIVHDHVQDMVNFIRRNGHMTFDYVEMEYDIGKYRTTNVGDYRVLWKEMQNLSNVTDSAKNRIKDRLNEKENLRNMCKDYHSCISINMVNETICLCQRAPEINIPLTEENLIKRATTFPKDLFRGISKGCNSCTRLYVEKCKRGIENTMILRKHLS